MRQAGLAIRLAKQVAQRFGHEYVGTEHILLGLLEEGGGVAATVLRSLGVNPRRVRLEVEKILGTGPVFEPLVLSRVPPTPRAQKAIEYAVEEARGLNHNYVGTEHLLLGLLREEEGVAAQVLLNLGARLDEVREAVRRELARPPVDLAWLWRNGGAAEKIAQKIAEDHRWQNLPILADALKDAGCEDAEMLGHLRLGAGHGCPPLGHGCWVLDRLLGARAGEDDGDQRPARRWWQFWR